MKQELVTRLTLALQEEEGEGEVVEEVEEVVEEVVVMRGEGRYKMLSSTMSTRNLTYSRDSPGWLYEYGMFYEQPVHLRRLVPMTQQETPKCALHIT